VKRKQIQKTENVLYLEYIDSDVSCITFLMCMIIIEVSVMSKLNEVNGHCLASGIVCRVCMCMISRSP